MNERFSCFRSREVICISTGGRLGYVSDAEIDLSTGEVKDLIIPGRLRFFGLLGREDDYILPWSSVRRFGGDFILVDDLSGARRCRRTGLL